MECRKLLGLLLDTLELLVRVLRKIDRLETTILESPKRLEHTLKPKHFLSHLLNVHLESFNILIDVDSRHRLVLI